MANRKDRQLIIPDIRWDQQDLTSNQSVMNFVQQLQGKGLVSMSTVLPMLGLDPEIEKKNLETERGTVFDPNAPKTGPLPNTGELPSGGNGGGAKPPMPGGGPGKPGTTPPAGGGSPATPATPTPAQPPKPPTDNSPAPSTKETSLNVDDFFTKSGDSVEQVNPRKVTRVIHSNSQKPNKVGEN
jgi:hypothetical protein